MVDVINNHNDLSIDNTGYNLFGIWSVLDKNPLQKFNRTFVSNALDSIGLVSLRGKWCKMKL